MAQAQGKVMMLLMLTVALIVGPAAVPAAEKGGGGSIDTLKQYVLDLKKSPESVELREKVTKYSQTLKQKPPVPEEFERQMARGAAFMKKANDAESFKKAVDEFESAVALAPWGRRGGRTGASSTPG